MQVTTVGFGQASVSALSPRWLSMKTRSFSAESCHLIMDILGRSQFPCSPLHYPHHWLMQTQNHRIMGWFGWEGTFKAHLALPWHGYLSPGFSDTCFVYSDLFKFPRSFPLFMTINGGIIFLILWLSGYVWILGAQLCFGAASCMFRGSSVSHAGRNDTRT